MLDDPAYSDVAKAIEEGILEKRFPELRCTVCNADMQIDSARSHLRGTRHRKALTNRQLQEASKRGAPCDPASPAGPGLLAAISKGQVVSRNIGSDVLLTCVPCSVSFRGEIAMIQHLASEGHARKAQQEGMSPDVSPARAAGSTPLPSTPSSPAMQVQDVYEAIRSGIVIQTTAASGLVTLTCSLCHKPCNGEVTMRQHLTSAAHAAQLRRNEQRLRLFPTAEPSAATATAGRQFDSVSTATSSPAEGNGAAQAMASPADPNGDPHYCAVCRIQCTGRESMDQHLSGKSHQKRLMTAVMQRPSLSPARDRPVVTITPTTTSQTDSASPAATPTVQGVGAAQARDKVIVVPPEPDEGNWLCRVCDVPCTGRESMEQHLRGKSHEKKLRMQQQRLSLSPAREPSPVTAPPSTATTTWQADSASAANMSTVQGNGVPQAMASPADPTGNPHYCSVCEIPCTGRESMDQHLKGKSHLKKLRLQQQRLSLSPAREPSPATATPSTTTTAAATPITTTAAATTPIATTTTTRLSLSPARESSPVAAMPTTTAAATPTASTTASTSMQPDSPVHAVTSTGQGSGVGQAMASPARPYGNPYYCPVCCVPCNSVEQMDQHLKGKSHLKKLRGTNYGELRDNSEDSPGSPMRTDSIQLEESVGELTKDIRIYGPNESLADMFDEVVAV